MHNTKLPFFSVIVCTYNRKHLLIRAVQSLLKQDCRDFECKIIDDGSNDGSYEYLHELCSNDDRFTFVFHKNRGHIFAKNLGILLANGDYITFLDSDDEYLENHLSSRKEILEKYPEIDFLHGGVEIVGYEFVPDFNNPDKLIHIDKCVIGGTFFIKNNIIKKIGFYPKVTYGEDFLMFQNSLKAGINVQITDIKTYRYYRNTKDSIAASISSAY